MRPRTVETTLAKPAKIGRFEHAVGAPIAFIDKFTEKDTGIATWFYAPKVDGMYLNRAEALIDECLKKKAAAQASRRPMNSKDPTVGDAFGDKDSALDFFETGSIAIILLHATIEFIANLHIELAKDLHYVVRKDVTVLKLWGMRLQVKRDVVLSIEQVLFLSLDEKLKSVLPGHYAFTSPASQSFWQDYVELKKLRDELVHITRDRSYGASRGENSVYARLFEVDFMKLLKGTESLIDYVEGECRKRPQV